MKESKVLKLKAKKKNLIQAHLLRKDVGLVRGDGTCNTSKDIDKFLYDEELNK